jgi:TonB family protein
MTTARSRLVLTSIAWLALASVADARDDMIDRVKDLYRSAAYEEALAVLEQMAKDPASARPVEAREYRLLCLIALERRVEAREAITSMVNADPLYQLSQASPRVRAMFKDVRQSLLPSIVQQAYGAAKAAFDRQDPQSGAQFDRVLTLLDDPDIAGMPTMGDLRTVASAFRDLSQALARRPEPPASPPPPIAQEVETPTPPAPIAPIVYRDGEPDLVVPEALNQALPRWVLPPGSSGRDVRGWVGVLEVLIDENGDVVSATLRKSFHPAYDAQLVKAAMSWKYRPARKSGMPVRFVKVVSVRLDN